MAFTSPPRVRVHSPPPSPPFGIYSREKTSPNATSRLARKTARMAIIGATANAVEAAKVLLPRGTLIEKTEMAVELDAVAAFHYPGVRGWEDLDGGERSWVMSTASKKLMAKRDATLEWRHRRMMRETL